MRVEPRAFLLKESGITSRLTRLVSLVLNYPKRPSLHIYHGIFGQMMMISVGSIEFAHGEGML